MSEFDHRLHVARKQQRALYSLITAVFVVGAVLVVGLIGYSSGTPIRIHPQDASQIGEIEVRQGIALAFADAVYTLSDVTEIDVSAPGFETLTRTITPDEKGTTLTVTLRELPGRIVVRTSPAQIRIRWSIDGNRVAISEVLDHKLVAGEYDLRIDHSHFEIESQKIEVERGKSDEFMIKLKRVKGSLKVLSSPSGAAVVVDGREVGETPVEINLGGGGHDLKIRNTGYQTISDQIEITNLHPTIARNYSLQRMKATLTFKVEPTGGRLLVNGRKVNPAKPISVESNVETALTYALEGYFTEDQQITLAANEIKSVIIRLKQEIGDVDVWAEPSAKIFVDGVEVGETPALLRLPSREHQIEFRRDGYRSIVKTVLPSSKHASVLHERLITESAARLSEAPKTYKNAVGIEFKLFQPSDFVMGAPRHEIGQRANEFLRKIKLTKYFYAGKHEVTNQQFKTFKPEHSASGKDLIPVTSVSWLEAVAFCNWLSDKEGLELFYVFNESKVSKVNRDANGYRLLTEAEWEWLARRASRRAQTVFPWGDDTVVPPMAGNIADESAQGLTRFYVPNYSDGYSGIAAVGSFAAESSGLFDLTGNVSEWVHDVYSLHPPVSNLVEVDPVGPAFGSSHVIKGSNWRSGTRTTLRSAFRNGLTDRKDDVGFRIGRYL